MGARVWCCGGFSFQLDAPLIMGICNVTPDSFSDGGDHADAQAAIAFALQQVADGAHIIDVGGESTRPGSAAPAEAEEARRVVPVIRALAAHGVPVSVDTRHAGVAQAALDAGACILNDVSGFREAGMREVAAASDAGLVVMHMLGEPGTMQQSPRYDDVAAEVEGYLLRQAATLEGMGIARERICLDPGVGFGKTHAHNAALLAATRRMVVHGYPYMVAVSRKSYIGAMTGLAAPKERDGASALCAAAACEDGAHVARAHNVALTAAMLRESRRAVVALGSNQGDCDAHLDAAIAALRATPGVWVDRVSAHVHSEPAYLQQQPTFTNAVALLQTTLGPEELLAKLQAIELREGRVRGVPNGPRTLDLDIVDYEGVTSADPQLMLPHPLALERAFVVEPLLAVAPGHVLADGTPVTADAVRVGTLC